jgi:hypothetical protein
MDSVIKYEEAADRPFVLGRKRLSAITALEGLKLSLTSEQRLNGTETLPPEERRAETIRAYAGSKSSR